MPLINKTIQGIYNGVSQQSKSIRLETQNEDERNAYNTLVRGLEQRPGTELVGSFETGVPSTITGEDVLVHKIKRDNNEEYLVLFTPDPLEPIRICRISDGFKMTVNYAESNDRTYCIHQPSTTSNEIRAVTAADTTIIANKSQVTSLGAPLSPSNSQPFALIWVRKTALNLGAINLEFQINVNGTLVLANSVDENTNAVATDIKTALDGALTGYTVAKVGTAGSILKITKDDLGDFDITSNDSIGNTAILVVKDKVEKITDLPNKADDGDIIQVIGDNGVESQGSFYVRFEDSSQRWVETLAGGIQFQIDDTTMPREMVRGTGDTFDVSKISWEDREVGDLVSTPNPSFIGQVIEDVLFHKGRLCILSHESSILSRSGDFFNFFPRTATEVLDDDPIDVPNPANSVAILRRGLPFEDSLLITSDDRQFALTSGGGSLTPKTANMDETTSYEFSNKHRPIRAGSNLYFAVEKNRFSSVREYFVQPDTLIREAADITSHVPRYLPKDIKQIISNSNQHFLGLVSYNSEDKSNLYVYNYLWIGSENKPLSAWNKWTFGDFREVLGGDFFGNDLYLMFRDTNSDGTSDIVLERVQIDEVTTGTLPIRLHGDRIIDPSTHTVTALSSGSPPNVITTVTLPVNDQFVPDSLEWLAIHKTSGIILQGQRPSTLDDDEVNFPGDITTTLMDYLFVKKFEFFVRLSELYIKDGKDQSLPTGVLKLKNILVSFTNSGPFEVRITPKNRDTLTHVWTGAVIGVADLDNPLSVIDTRDETFLVKANSRDTTIDIVSNSPYPLQLQSVSYSALFNPRSRVI